MSRTLAALLAAIFWTILTRTAAQAHVVCGDRVFPTTLTMDDPGISDEMSLPTIILTPTPGSQNNGYGFEYDKTITEDLGIAINGDYATQRSPGNNLSGWDVTTVTLKDQHPCINNHKHEEFAFSLGAIRVIPGSGSAQLAKAGAIPGTGSTAPTFYFGKGMGDLSSGVLRPIAITGEFSRAISDNPSASPNAWSYAASFQYSIPYFNQNVRALRAPQLFTRMTPLVEVAMTSPDQGSPTGTVSPGILYDAPTWQLGAEAVIPANRTTKLNQGTGFIIQYHMFLDTYYKSWFGHPLINTNIWGEQ